MFTEVAWPAKNRLGNKGVSLTAGHPGKLSEEVNNKAKNNCIHGFLRKKRKGKGEGELRGKVPSFFFSSPFKYV